MQAQTIFQFLRPEDLEAVRRPLARASLLPPKCYSDPGIFALEIEQASARRDLQFIEQQLARLDEEAKRCSLFIPSAIEMIAQMPQPADVTEPTR